MLSRLKIILMLIPFLLFAACSNSGGERNVVKVQSLTIVGGDVELKVGDDKTLKVSVLPGDAKNKSVSWDSSNYEVASITQSGLLTAESVGTAVITAKSKDGSDKSNSIKVTVKAGTDTGGKLVESVLINGGDRELQTGKTANLSVTVLPTDAADKSVIWTSSNTAAATVTQFTGVVTAVAVGSTTIKAAAQDGSGISGSIIVTVSDEPPILVESVLINSGIRELKPGDTEYLIVSVLPENAGNKGVTWSTNDPHKATVNPTTGLVTAVAVGSAIITATAQDGSGKSDSVTITIIPQLVTSVAIDGGDFSLMAGESRTLSATALPDDASNKTLNWTSTHANVASVNQSGLVSAHAAGTATITATAQDGSGIYDSVTVTVTHKLITSITIDGGSFSLMAGDSKPLSVTILPTDVGDKQLIWSSGSDHATVNEIGVVTAVSVGTAVITAAAQDGSGETGSVTVTVTARPVESVAITVRDLSLMMGTTSQLTAYVLPENATNKSITWSSGNTGIATVDANGLVTAVGVGTTTIIATIEGKSDSIPITVTNIPPPLVTSITINDGNFSLMAGKTKPLSFSVLPVNAGNKNVTWSSNNTGVATVDSNGVVNAHVVGTAQITAAAQDNSGVSASVTVTVTPILVESIVFNNDEDFSLMAGTSGTLNVTVLPGNAANKTINWTTNNPGVATVSSNGVVTAVSVGTAQITATAADGSGVSAGKTVTVTPKRVTSITIDGGSFSIIAGETKPLTATVLPADAGNKTVDWNSNNTSVATVNQTTGLVTAVSVGSATITASAADGSGISGSIIVTVNPKLVTSVTINGGNFSLVVGDSKPLSANVLPSDATNRNIIWSSNNTSVATVNQTTGMVTAGTTTGTATITAMAQDASGKSDSVTVTVTPKLVTSVAVNGGNFSLIVGENKNLGVTVLPNDATNKNVTWESSDANIAMVDQSGYVTAKATGTATITATAQDGSGKSGSVVVTVNPKPTGSVIITINPEADFEGLPASLSLRTTGTPAQTQLGITLTGTGVSNAKWYIDGVEKATGATYTLNATGMRVGDHYLTISVVLDGHLYSKVVVFTVSN